MCNPTAACRHGRGSLILLLIAGVLIGGCSREDQPYVLARVNGYEITLARFQQFYQVGTRDARPVEEQYQVLNERLDQLIGYILIQEAARAQGMHRTPEFGVRQEMWERDTLSRVVKQREIIEAIHVPPAEVNDLAPWMQIERHFQHVLVLDEESASDVTERLRAGEDWGSVAEAFSRDDEAKIHRGDIGWHRYGQQPFSLYRELQERAFDMPVGSWEGPIREGGEYHFLKVIAERPRAGVTGERAWAEARNLLAERTQADMMQAFTNRMWERGGYHLDEDQFHWWYDRLQASFRTDPTNNPVPVLTREDQARVIVRSTRNRPYTARMLNERVELINPRARRMDITGGDINDWRRKILSDWVLVDEIADYARSRGYHRDPAFLATQERYIDGRLYALKLEELRRSVTALSDEQLLGYWRANRRALNQPERRELIEVLLATREEAEEIRRRAEAGEDLEELAARHTIRQGFRDLGGRFSPISRGEFGTLGEAVFETPDGEIGPIVETPLGFSVFRVTTVHPARETTFEEMQQPMREALLQEGQQAVVSEFTQQAFEQARIWKDEELLRRFTAEMVELATEMKERRQAEDEAEARAQAEWEEQIRRQLPPPEPPR